MRRAHSKNQLGVDPADLPTSRREQGPSRRDLLIGSLGAAALLPLAACGDNLKPGAGPGIAIIGGGIAGLTASYFLQRAGIRADVYEGSMRIGGRMFTNRDALAASGQLVELGGELVDSDHLVIPALAQIFGLMLDDLVEATPGLTQDTFHFDGAALAEMTLVDEFAPVAAKMAIAVAASEGVDAASVAEFERIDNMSIPEWLELEAGLDATSSIRRLLEVAYLEEYGLEVDQQSAWNLITLIDYSNSDPFRVFGDSDERYHIHQGSDALPLAMAAQLDDRIHLDHKLTKVSAGAAGYRLTFSTTGGERVVDVDHVVYALPFTKLREVDLVESNLPDDKLTIIRELGYGTNAKLMMQFSDRHWELEHGSSGSAISDVGDLQALWSTSRGQSGSRGLLTNYVGGDRGIAIGEGSPEMQATIVLPWIDSVFPGTAEKYIPGSAVRQHWPTYEFTKGSYASYRVGQWAFFGQEGARVDNQHFCGEHCSEDFQGFMEGGAETGAMVAAEICDDLDVRQPALLAGLLSQLVERPRASYHAGFGEVMKISQVRRR